MVYDIEVIMSLRDFIDSIMVQRRWKNDVYVVNLKFFLILFIVMVIWHCEIKI